MQKILHRRSFMIKPKNNEVKEEIKKKNQDNQDTQDKKDKQDLNKITSIKNKGILNLICLYQIENDLLIDEIIPSIAFKFSKIGNVKIELYQSDLKFLFKDSIYIWTFDKNNNIYNTDNIEIKIFDKEFEKKNYDNLSIILIANNSELDKYLMMFDYSIFVEHKDNTNKIIIEKKQNIYSVFNPFNYEPKEISNDYNFYTISKQYLIKKMLNYKLDKIATNKKENYKLFDTILNYLSIDTKSKEKLNSEFESIKQDEIFNFIKKLNKYFVKQYDYSYKIN